MDIGTTINQYRIIDRIGEGGMGIVYLAEDTRLHRKVALKFISNLSPDSTEEIARFRREAQAAARLNHPNICTIHELGETDDQTYIAMEHIDGTTLKERLRAGSIPEHDIRDWLEQIAKGLQSAHNAGVVHRDIKPANIMITGTGLIKIMDFGIAKLVESETELTQANSAIGTIAYMSPEQARGEEIDQRTDIWSVGVILYELMTGQRPFNGAFREAIMYAMMHTDAVALSEINPNCSYDLEQIVARCLQRSQNDRYDSMDELLDDLQEKGSTSGISDQLSDPQHDDYVHDRTGSMRFTSQRRIGLPYHYLAMASIVIAAWVYFTLQFYPTKTPTFLTAQTNAAVPLTSMPGTERHPAFSPGGNEIAFAWNGGSGNNFDIYVQTVGTYQPQQLTDHAGIDTRPQWSPDGRLIFFQRVTGNKRSIHSIPSRGGVERKIFPLAQHEAIEVNEDYLTLSPSGKYIVAPYKEIPLHRQGLLMVDLETSRVDTLTRPVGSNSPSTDIGDFDSAFSPDGRFIAFTRWKSFSSHSVFSLDVSNLRERRLTEERELTQYVGLTWTSDSQYILFEQIEPTSQSIYGVSRKGGKLHRILPGSSSIKDIDISADFKKMVYTEYNSYDTDLFKLELDRSEPGDKSPRPIFASTQNEYAGMLSPDGSKVVFVSMRSGLRELWIGNVNTEEVYRITDFEHRGSGSPSWSPDGALIAFDDNNLEGNRNIYVVDPQGGPPKQLTSEENYDAIPRWSRDGQWIYFRSQRTGESEIWKIPKEGGEAIQITKNGGRIAMESPDGRWLYYTKVTPDNNAPYDRWSIWRMATAEPGGKEFMILDDVHFRNWVVVDRGIYYQRMLPDGFLIEYFDFSANETSMIAQIDGNPSQIMDVSSDQSWLLFSKEVNEESDIYIIEMME